jgi:hypothetical protein
MEMDSRDIGLMIVGVQEGVSVTVWRPGTSTVLIKDPVTWVDLDCFSVDTEMTPDEMIRYVGERIQEADDLCDDGQPTEYEEWQDFHGGDDWDHGQFNDGC